MGKPKTIWVYDNNFRVYEDDHGNRTQSPNYRLMWHPHKVVDETSRSWILEYGQKVPKKDPPKWAYAFSEEEVNQVCYIENNAYKISEKVRRAPYEQLKQIATIIGFEPTLEDKE